MSAMRVEDRPVLVRPDARTNASTLVIRPERTVWRTGVGPGQVFVSKTARILV